MPDPKKLCFVLMPFKDDMKEVYWDAIKPACEKAGFTSLRVDELKGAFNINRKTIEHIFSSAAIVADLTGWNPNVFYEMGVAHTIANKTITIIQKKDELPFDVAPYRGIFYEQTEAGLVKLREDIVESLQNISDWCQHPSNPVQDFKPLENKLPQQHVEMPVPQPLDEKRESAPPAKPKSTKERFWTKFKLKRQSADSVILIPKGGPSVEPPTPAWWWSGQTKIIFAVILVAIAVMSYLKWSSDSSQKKSVSQDQSAFLLHLRNTGDTLSIDDVKKMLIKRGFSDKDWNKDGRGLKHRYKLQISDGGSVVFDSTTGLAWQQSGSLELMNYAGVKDYLDKLNNQHFDSSTGWRLPTLEEAMSLMESERKHGNLYIDPIFDLKQSFIWTADIVIARDGSSRVWAAHFDDGECSIDAVDATNYVRAVR